MPGGVPQVEDVAGGGEVPGGRHQELRAAVGDGQLVSLARTEADPAHRPGVASTEFCRVRVGDDRLHPGILGLRGRVRPVKIILVDLQGEVLLHFLLRDAGESDGGVQVVVGLLHLLDVPGDLVPLLAVHLLGPAPLLVAHLGRAEAHRGRVHLLAGLLGGQLGPAAHKQHPAQRNYTRALGRGGGARRLSTLYWWKSLKCVKYLATCSSHSVDHVVAPSPSVRLHHLESGILCTEVNMNILI